MTSIIERNSGKSAYLLRHALNSSNACCSSSAFSDSVMISSSPIVIALLIFPTLLLQLIFQSRLLFGANSLAGIPHTILLCHSLGLRFHCDRRFDFQSCRGFFFPPFLSPSFLFFCCGGPASPFWGVFVFSWPLSRHSNV